MQLKSFGCNQIGKCRHTLTEHVYFSAYKKNPTKKMTMGEALLFSAKINKRCVELLERIGNHDLKSHNHHHRHHPQIVTDVIIAKFGKIDKTLRV